MAQLQHFLALQRPEVILSTTKQNKHIKHLDSALPPRTGFQPQPWFLAILGLS